MKKIVSLWLSIILAVSMLSTVQFSLFAADVSGKCGDNVTWSFNASNGTLTLSGSGNMYDYNDDASPAPWMNSYRNQITRVVCENGVTSVGSKAFMNCTSVTSIDLGSVRWIGWYAFYGCSSLGGVAIPDTVTNTWSGCFQNCTSIGWVNFGKGLTELSPYMFAGCNNGGFWWISLPENITSIGECAFYGCSNLGWNTIAGKNVSFGTDCFGYIADEATFIVSDKNSRDYLLNYWSKWTIRCLDDKHTLTNAQVVAPTCTTDGYTQYYCVVCDQTLKLDYVDALGHDYTLTSTSNSDYYFNYRCRFCGIRPSISALTLMNNFEPHLNAAKYEKDYSNEFDVNNDGVINLRDYRLYRISLNKVSRNAHSTSINTSATHQTLDGFGASACWWAQCAGGWSDEKLYEVISLLYDKEEGIGLNIYRYNLGAGSQNDSAIYTVCRRAECFLQSDGTYNWNADANAQRCLAVAKELYGDDLRVTLFANSAPVYYTSNGRAYGNFVPEGGAYSTNLPSSNYSRFANFGVTCAEHFTQMGYRVTALSLINEPEWAWGSYNADNTSAPQEGCYFTGEQARDFYKQAITEIQKSSVSGTCKLEAWESGQMGGSKTQFDNYLAPMFGTALKYRTANSALRGYFDTLSIHSYWTDEAGRRATASLLSDSAYNKYGVAITEYCQMDGSSSGLGIKYGLDLADTIYQDLTILNAKEWDWWVALAEGGYMDGLIYTDYQNTSSNHDIETSKRLWVMGNFSKYTREGSVRIDVSYNVDGVKVCGFDNKDGTVTLVYINSGDNDEYAYFDASQYSSFSAYVTDAEYDLECTQLSESAANYAVIPANSVTTVVLVKR